MQWLYLFFFLECGIVPIETSPMMPSGDQYYYTHFNADAFVFDHLIVGGSTRCLFTHRDGGVRFLPQVMEYTFRAALVFGPAEVGARYQCNHRRQSLDTLGGYAEFYLRLSSPPHIQPGN